MDTMPDTVLTLAAIAPFASSPTTITNVANLRVKECDRLSAAATELTRLGVKVEEGADWIRVYPVDKLNPASVRTYDDHRVAMAFSVPGLIQSGIRIEDPECVKKSFPTYWDELERFRFHHHASAA
jgi:3-phosphoshikimate 1-carboxyvinyltransferase